MPSANRIVAFDIGSHTIKMGEFLLPKDGHLTLTKFDSASLGLDPNKEESRSEAIMAVLKGLLVSSGIKAKSRVAFSVAGHAIFMRNVKLPAVDELQVEQMITFEAQQIVPFPLTEVVWDYQILPGKERSPEREAVIVAIKSDLLETENSNIRAAGLNTEIIDVGPLALYNAFRYNYTPQEACTLLIDFGARSTNLIFIENNRFYTRFLTLAGNTISQTICNEFQEPFFIAEGLKIDRGGVNLGGSYAVPQDRDTARLWKIIRNAMNRVHTEINRSIIFYRNQQGGTAPVEILITGGTSCLPYLDHFLSERFGVPVNRFNPLQNVNLAPGIDTKRLSAVGVSMGEVVGLALRASGHCPVEISLIPQSVESQRQNEKQKPTIYAALVTLFLLFVALSLALYQEYNLALSSKAKITQDIEILKKLEQKQTPLEKTNDALLAEYAQVEKIFTQREAWVRLLSDLHSKIPQGVWITQLTPSYNGQTLDLAVGQKNPPAAPPRPPANKNPGSKNPAPAPETPMMGAPEINQLDIRGMYENGLQPEVINQFVTALADLGWFEIDPQKVNDSIVSADTPQGEGQLSWNYTLRLKLKKPIDLRP